MIPKTYLLILCALLSITSLAQEQQQQTRLIIRGDDMGYSHAGNVALIQAYTEGIEQSIEVIVPSPWFPEAVAMLKAHPKVDVGVHLAITSEWDNVKWRPLSDCPSLKDEDGYFFPMVWPNKNYPGKSIQENKWVLADIEKEFRAQIEMALKYIPRVSHLSAHMGCTELSGEVIRMTSKLAKEYNIDIDLTQHNVYYVGYEGPYTTLAEKKASFIKMLEKLQPGGTYMFVDHPGIDSPELRAIHHIGYENVAADRDGVTRLWTDADIKAAIKKLNIKLISYRDLIK